MCLVLLFLIGKFNAIWQINMCRLNITLYTLKLMHLKKHKRNWLLLIFKDFLPQSYLIDGLIKLMIVKTIEYACFVFVLEYTA